MAMTSSPLMSAHHQPSTGSHPCSPSLRPSSSSLGLSSSALPPLPPLARPALPASTSVPAPVASDVAAAAPPPPSNSPRSYARAPTQRPYASPLSSRAHLKHSAMELCSETKRFADLVAHNVQRRSQQLRHAGHGSAHSHAHAHAHAERRGHSLPGSLAGSWEKERAELIVDIPVWSPGCFSDLSTLHALRDTTLAHTHALLGYMLETHTIAGTYRLLTRSAAQQGYGWGCVRLAPQAQHPGEHQVLKQVDHTGRNDKAALSNMARVQSKPARKGILDNAVYSDDEDEEVELKRGYRSGSASDEEEEVEPTDVVVEREIARRGSKEGTAFVMIVHGQPALILT